MRDAELPTEEYALLDLLERLESLVEDMDDLKITTRPEAEALIERLHARLDRIAAPESVRE